MGLQRSSGLWVVALSFAAAMWLSIMPLPEWAYWARPSWVTMVLIYWVLALPTRVGIATAWVVGLLLDILEGTPPGQHAFALSVVAYLLLVLYQRLRMYIAWQQAGIVFVLVGIDALINQWIQTLIGRAEPTLWFLLPALVSALLWPWLLLLLRRVRRRFGVT